MGNKDTAVFSTRVPIDIKQRLPIAKAMTGKLIEDIVSDALTQWFEKNHIPALSLLLEKGTGNG